MCSERGPTAQSSAQMTSILVCESVSEGERHTERENSYVGSEAPRLSYPISLIRTQTIMVPRLSSSFAPLLNSPHLSYSPATTAPRAVLYARIVFPPLSSHPHLSIHPSNRKYQSTRIGWLQSLALINQTRPLRDSCFECHPALMHTLFNDLKLFC